MRYAHHGGTTLYANLVDDIRLARELGYDSIELWTPKVLRYLDAGFTADDLADEPDGLAAPMLDVLAGVERQDPRHVAQRLDECARLSEAANRLGCPAIQIVATDKFGDSSWPSLREVLVDSISALADVAATHGIRLANPRSGPTWRDCDRTALPGDGVLPLAEVVDAVTATGYRGHWCVEMLSPKHREWLPRDLASALSERLRQFVPPLAGQPPHAHG